MAAKCALVVDDSKSARAFLSRILEKHLLEVDCVESAEDAIEYLTRHRPDVIFMDHLMPGMDGFQAVQAIKNNPRTATIPILMYTSQEGELYLGQARALGAVGVLPKQIRPADVTQVLLQLHLFQERRSGYTGANDPTQLAPVLSGISTVTTPVLPPELQPGAAPGAAAHAASVADTPAAAATTASGRYSFGSPVDQLLRDQIAEVRRTLVARLDELQDGLPSQLHEAVRAGAPPPPELPAPPAPDRRGWLVAAMLAAVALLFAVLWAQERGRRAILENDLVALAERAVAVPATVPPPEPQPAATPEQPAPAAAVPVRAGAAPRARLPNSPVVFSVPFGETPLAGDRVGAVRAVMEDLRRGGFRGEVELQVFHGRFCLVGNAAEGYSLPPDDLAFNRCDRVGGSNVDGGASRESLPFANMLAEQQKAAGQGLTLRVAEGADRPVQPYPEPGSMTVAGPWNASAAANNRVEMRWRERP
jgi:CheY-like chemotaxis protein